MFGTLTTTDAYAVLRQERIGRLGVWDGQRVSIYPVNYGFDGETLYLQSREGEKIRAMREHPEVCLQVDQVSTPARWRSKKPSGEFGSASLRLSPDAMRVAIWADRSTYKAVSASLSSTRRGRYSYRVRAPISMALPRPSSKMIGPK